MSVMTRVGLSLLELASRTRFWTQYRQMLAFERQPEQDRLDAQTRSLSALLRHAGTFVPCWREQFDLLGVSPGEIKPDEARRVLGDLPVTTKEWLRSGFPQRVTAEGQRDEWRLQASAGTTDRLTVVNDFPKRDSSRAAELRGLTLAVGRGMYPSSVEIPPDACNVVCGLADPLPQDFLPYLWTIFRQGKLREPSAMADLRGRFERQWIQRRVTLQPINPAPWKELCQTLDDRLDTILRVRPQIVRGLPIYLVWLASRALERGLKFPGLRAVLPFGGMMSSAMAARVEAGFGAPFRDLYGTGELGMVAASCGKSRGLHVFDDLFVVEVLRDGRAVDPGQVGRVTITDLSNYAMPIVRYDVGDIGSLIDEPCPCGRSGRRLVLHGRCQETLADSMGDLITGSECLDLIFADSNVQNGRVDELRPGQFNLTLVVAEGSDEPGDLAVAFRRRIGEDRVRQVRTAPFIRPEASGKYRVAFGTGERTAL
jgi:phenylacetate-coenzyme A ligase PaaK-like adenylate-forming protein